VTAGADEVGLVGLVLCAATHGVGASEDMGVYVRGYAAIAGVLGMASIAAATAAQATSRFSPTTGFQQPDGKRWGRPVDAVPGPDGALYVSDDQAGAIYRLVPPSLG
jgi:hypothetical protein